jgi:hypothetical protein
MLDDRYLVIARVSGLDGRALTHSAVHHRVVADKAIATPIVMRAGRIT